MGTQQINETLDSFKKLDEHTYLMNFTADYGLDTLLEKGVNNVGALLKFVQNHFKLQKKTLTMDKGGYACTTFNVFNKEGQHLLARNFDYKDAENVVVWSAPENGYKSVAVTDVNIMLYGREHQNPTKTENHSRFLAAPYCCMDGINEKGLAIAVLELKDKATNQQRGKKGIITTAAIRAVLDKCENIDEVIEFFENHDMHDSLFCNYHYHVADASGRSVIIEYVKNEMNLIYPEDKNQYAMNFYLTKGVYNAKDFGFERRDKVLDAFKKNGGIMEEGEAMKLLERCKLYYKHKRGYMITSLWSAVYNCNEKTMLYCGGMNYSVKYKFSPLKPGVAERVE